MRVKLEEMVENERLSVDLKETLRLKTENFSQQMKEFELRVRAEAN